MKRVFVHGWSYDSRFWSPLCAALGETAPWLIEQGYTSLPVQGRLPEEPFVAITHSAGTMWLLGQDLRHCKGIFAINGFARLVTSDGDTGGWPRRVLERMRRKLAQDPMGVVSAFRARIGDPLDDPRVEESAAMTLDPAALDRGLGMLIDNDLSPQLHQWTGPMIWVAGADDPLDPKSRPKGPVIVRGGGHCLPLEAPGDITALLQEAERQWAA